MTARSGIRTDLPDATFAPGSRAPDIASRITDWSSLSGDDEKAWDALALTAAEPNPFYESWYLLPSLRALDPKRRISLFRFEVDDQLAGLMPLGYPLRYYRWPILNITNWVHDNCFCGAPLVAAGFERPFWRALFARLDRRPGPAMFLHLRAIPLGGPIHDALIDVLAEQRRVWALVHHEERALLATTQSAQDYFASSLSAKKRKELRRQFTRLSELGDIAFTRKLGMDGIDNWVDEFLMLEASGWKGRSGSALASQAATARLAREAIGGAAMRGRVECLTLSLDGRAIAMLATFLTSPGAFSFKTAFDEEFARFSPGVLLQREYLAVLNRDDIAWTDSCASADHPMIDHIWRERRAIGRISIGIGGSARQAIFSRLAAAETRRRDLTPADNPGLTT